VSATAGSPTSAVPSNWNIANGLTALRIAMVPLFAAVLLHGDGKQTDWRIAAAVAFAVAVATDRIDGELARSRGLVTNLGKIADPIADKALIGAALISLSMLDELWWTVTGLILARELGITLLRFIVIRHGVMPAGRGGKAKTVAQSLAILIYIAPLPDPVQPVAKVAMGVAVVLTLTTGLDYMIQAYRMRESSERTRLKRAARRALRRPAPGALGPTGGSEGEGSAGEGSVGPRSVGPGSVEPGSVEPASVDKDSAGKDSASGDAVGVDAMGVDATGVDAIGVDAMGLDATGTEKPSDDRG
jgi:CDP-diacylglycerol--glycerol-3-phosphate 3-phosphatidyltransferase